MEVFILLHTPARYLRKACDRFGCNLELSEQMVLECVAQGYYSSEQNRIVRVIYSHLILTGLRIYVCARACVCVMSNWNQTSPRNSMVWTRSLRLNLLLTSKLLSSHLKVLHFILTWIPFSGLLANIFGKNQWSVIIHRFSSYIINRFIYFIIYSQSYKASELLFSPLVSIHSCLSCRGVSVNQHRQSWENKVRSVENIPDWSAAAW